ncbi:hypothetical protein [Streptomyces lonarensis]|uniref:Uncharacterized protein n=1 Tax=Streptomyces lonarensis TaxID=700599 RepID=A0A7X6CXA8_9ACTN|nr:hypothetical protein [Streptomyces lonarensis]NJQ04257.1 hypothetical protein [Streptomyces lonarensis]
METVHPTCVTCRRPLPGTDLPRYACSVCQAAAARMLADLPALYLSLSWPARRGDVEASRGAAFGSRPPISLAALDATARGSLALQALTGWVRDWAETLSTETREIAEPEWPEGHAGQVVTACRWLRWHLDAACRSHAAIDEALAEIRDAYREVAAAAGEPGPRVVRLLCPCGGVLTADATTRGVLCRGCGKEHGRAALGGLQRAPRSGGVAA